MFGMKLQKMRREKFEKLITNMIYGLHKFAVDGIYKESTIIRQRILIEEELKCVDYPISQECFKNIQKVIWALGGTIIWGGFSYVMCDIEIMWADKDDHNMEAFARRSMMR